MEKQDIHIVPYSEDLHDGVMQMEKGITQGTTIQLEILKKHFLDRARVFEEFYANLAVNADNTIAGAAIGSKTMLTVNGSPFEAGFGFDAKVSTSLRKKGIGKLLAKDLYKSFFRPLGLTKCFMTAKLTNAPILKVVSRALRKVWLYQFVYLTIPTSTRIDKSKTVRKASQQFNVQLFDNEKADSGYYTLNKNGLGFFHTWKVYTLRFKKINWFYKKGFNFLKKVKPAKYKYLPGEGEVLSFATLFNHSPATISGVNEILEQLEKQEIKYLLVCCRKNDCIYNYLETFSINTYKYWLVSDFSLNEQDNITIDVRCL